LPADVQERARWLEEHITEVIDGLPLSAEPGTRPWPAFDPVQRTLRQRERAKHGELTTGGENLPFRFLWSPKLSIGLHLRTHTPRCHVPPSA